MRSALWRVVCLILISLVVAPLGKAQVATGIPPFGSFGGGPFDSINLGNLNVHFSIPILHKAGRGVPLTYDMTYDSAVWYPATVSGNQTWQPVANWGWRGVTEVETGYVTYSSHIHNTCIHDPGQFDDKYLGWAYHDSFGVTHYFGGIAEYGCSSDSYIDLVATDGSGYRLKANADPSATIYDRTGAIISTPLQVQTGTGMFTDRNGNRITVNSSGAFTDTLGLTALAVTGLGTPTSPLVLTYTTPSGGSASYKINYVLKNIKTAFNCSSVGQFTQMNVPLVSFISLPDDTPAIPDRYTFDYEATLGPGNSGYTTGRLISVKIPSGGIITYAYSGGSGDSIHNAINCSDGSTSTLTRTLNPGGQWTYARTQVSGPHWQTTVTTPPDPSAGNTMIIDFQKDSSTGTPTNNFYEVQRQEYQGANTTLRTMVTCYNGQTLATCPTAAVISPILRTTTVTYLPDASSTFAKRDQKFSAFGLLNELDEYDFGAGSPARMTIVNYAALGNNINDRPSSIVVKDSQGLTKASTIFTYDEGTPAVTSGTPQHVAVTGSRGNLTTLARQANSTAILYNKLSYFDTGTVKTSTEPSTSNTTNGATTTYNYAAGTSCGNSFVTSVNLPLSFSRSITWNCQGGVQLSVTDENQKTTTLGFTDPYFWRQTSVSYPDAGQTTITYNTVTAPWNTIVSSKLDTSRNVTSKSVFDGFGRLKQEQVTSDPNGVSYKDTTYDALDRLKSVSNPYYSTSDLTYGLTSYAFDALGRPNTITRPDNNTVLIDYTKAATRVQDEGNGTVRVTKIYQGDGLGQLKSVCEVTSASLIGLSPTPGPCGQDISATGFLTSYLYDTLGNAKTVSQAGLNPRSYTFDMLSRLISETNPESGAKTYNYDTGRAGDLYQRIAPKPNQTGSATVTTTYSYDVLHRLTQMSYDDGTPTASFSYDQTQAFGITGLTNTLGRVSSAYTTSGSTTLAAQIFKYDQLGRIKANDQCIASNCSSAAGFQPLPYAYDLLGNMTSSQITCGYMCTYTYDTAARLTQMTSSLVDATHPGTLLSGVQYNALGLMKSATMGTGTTGNGITETRGYDNLGRLKTLSSSVIGGGSIYLVPVVNYTPNGNLLGVTDSILGGAWTYTYDDFNRIKTTGATNSTYGTRNYSYDYDRYGNRLHQNAPQGGSAPQYIFDANNRISGSGVTYDAAGNITNDGFHSYTYDAEGRIRNVDGTATSYVYDAMGRRVQRTSGSVIRYFAFDLSSRVIFEYDANTAIRFETYAGNRHLATYSAGLVFFDVQDFVGSERVKMTQNGTSFESTANVPFGDDQAGWGSALGQTGPTHFTGQDKDAESGLHHFWFRQLSTTQGRWTTPDPAGLGAVDLTNPQSWNQYAYVLDNPLLFTDPLGLVCDEDCMFNRIGAAFAGGTGACTLNGLGVSCGFAADLLKGDIAFICPQNDCSDFLEGNKKIGADNLIYEWIQKQSGTGLAGYTFIIATGYWRQIGMASNLAANNCQAPFLCNPQKTTARVGPPQEWHPAKPASFLNKYGTQLSCEAAVAVADWADNDMTAFGGVIGMAAGYLRDAKLPAVGGLLLFGRVTVGTALIARSTCVPIAWGPEHF